MNLSQGTKTLLLYLPVPLLCPGSASSGPTVEWNIAWHYQGSSWDSNMWQALMKPKPAHGGKLVLRCCTVIARRMFCPADFHAEQKCPMGQQHKAVFGNLCCISALSWEHASLKLKCSESELLYIIKGWGAWGKDLTEVKWLQYSLMAFAVQIVHLP